MMEPSQSTPDEPPSHVSFHGPSAETSPLIDADDKVQAVHWLFKRYVDQMSEGCNNDNCTEILCRTGRRNTITKSHRRFTGGSTRQIALAVCAGPSPRKHLCPYYPPQHVPKTARLDQTDFHLGQVDPSSLTQLMIGTSVIKELYKGTWFAILDLDLERLHKDLSKLWNIVGQIPRPGEAYLSNLQLADALMPCFLYLLSKLPLQRLAPWTMIDREFISKGFAYPPKDSRIPADTSFNIWLVILDALEHEPHLRLLERVVTIISKRHALEVELARLMKTRNLRAEAEIKCCNLKNSVEAWLVDRISSRKSAVESIAIVVCLKKLYTKIWDSQPHVKLGSPCCGILILLRNLCLQISCVGFPEGYSCSHMPVIGSRLDAFDLARSFKDTRASAYHLLSFPSMFSTEEIRIYFRTINHLTMKEAMCNVNKAVALRRRMGISDSMALPQQIKYDEEHYLLLVVSRRQSLLWAFDQLWQRRRSELRRPLRVRLGEVDNLEVGQDMGGVQLEFFNLVCKEAFAEETAMFTTDPDTGFSYFKPISLQPLHLFELFGVLVALALYNGITLPVNLPRAFYVILLNSIKLKDHASTLPKPVHQGPWYSIARWGRLSMPENFDPQLIDDGWAVTAKSLQTVLDGEVADLDFSLPLEANGLQMDVQEPSLVPYENGLRNLYVDHASMLNPEKGSSAISEGHLMEIDGDPNHTTAWPGWCVWGPMAALAPAVEDSGQPWNAREYVESYIRFLIYGSVGPQWDAFLKGFWSTELFSPEILQLFSHADILKSHLEGTNKLDITDLRQAAIYEGYDPHDVYVTWFWKIVSAWPESKQRLLLKFVTAAERIPITGAKTLRFVIRRSFPNDGESLPTSSTCFGTLMLPMYESREVLARKLDLAVRFGSEGFGNS